MVLASLAGRLQGELPTDGASNPLFPASLSAGLPGMDYAIYQRTASVYQQNSTTLNYVFMRVFDLHGFFTEDCAMVWDKVVNIQPAG